MIRILLIALLFSIPLQVSSMPTASKNYTVQYDTFQQSKLTYDMKYKPKVEIELSSIMTLPKPQMPKIRKVLAIVTACSPYDSQADIDYYKEFGYEGATYNVAADMRQFKKGTKIRIPGYMDVSYPNKFWIVDSKGGPYIRDSVDRGIYHIDVKFATRYSAVKWGSQKIWIEVIDP